MTRPALRRPSLIGFVIVVLLAFGAAKGWAAWQRSQVGTKLAQAVQPGDIQMVSSTTCAVCTMAKRWFEANAVTFDECYVEKDEACAARLRSTGQQGVPVIFIKGQPQVGFDPQRVLRSLERS